METFGRYQLLSRVAVGGMAEIFLARSASLDGFAKNMVIKRIRPDLSEDERFCSLFIEEAKLTIALSHQNIVQVFDFGQVDGAYYLAMEHVYGCDLSRIVGLSAVRDIGLDPGLALYVMAEACRGLDYAHVKKGRDGASLNLVHRDISPHNILVSFDGEVKLTDFGVAKARGRVRETEPGTTLGKASYMAPEQAHSNGVVDARSDLFACGLVLWELLVGARAYEGPLDYELLRKVRAGEVPRPSTRSPGVPPEVDELVMRALAIDPVQRFATAREFAQALRELQRTLAPRVDNYQLQDYLEQHRDELRVVGFDEVAIGAEATGAMPTPSGPAAGGERTRSVRRRAPRRGTVELAPAPVTPAAETPWRDASPRAGMPLPAGTESPWRDPSPRGGMPLPPAVGSIPEVAAVIEAFRVSPSLWYLLELGTIFGAKGQVATALACYRVAAVKFAQVGLLAQALLACHRMWHLAPSEPLRAEFAALPTVVDWPDADLEPLMYRDAGAVEALLRELMQATPNHEGVGSTTPLLRNVTPTAFAEFACQAPLRSFDAGANVVEQGSDGRTMYLIAMGRVLVWASGPGQGAGRVYLSSLCDGDFFGENGFFTGAPRSATVEALYPVHAFAIDPEFWQRVVGDDEAARAILLRFYKERIVDVMLARSAIFGVLPADDRRALVERFALQSFAAGDTVIHEGEQSDQIYVIKSGTAEVFSSTGGQRRMLSVLGPGALFGEVAALRRVKRTASVIATTPIEALRLGGAEFHAVLDAKPDLRRKVFELIAARERENLDKIMSPYLRARLS